MNSADPKEGCSLAGIIDAHRSALRRIEETGRMLEKIDDAFREAELDKILVPIAVDQKGRCLSGFLSFSSEACDGEAIRDHIHRAHVSLRDIHCRSRMVKERAPQVVAEIEAELQASEWRALRALSSAKQKMQGRRDQFGLTAAEAALQAAYEAEVGIRVEFVIYTPTSAADMALKASYAAESMVFCDNWFENDDRFMSTLFERLGLLPPAAPDEEQAVAA